MAYADADALFADFLSKFNEEFGFEATNMTELADKLKEKITKIPMLGLRQGVIDHTGLLPDENYGNIVQTIDDFSKNGTKEDILSIVENLTGSEITPTDYEHVFIRVFEYAKGEGGSLGDVLAENRFGDFDQTIDDKIELALTIPNVVLVSVGDEDPVPTTLKLVVDEVIIKSVDVRPTIRERNFTEDTITAYLGSLTDLILTASGVSQGVPPDNGINVDQMF